MPWNFTLLEPYPKDVTPLDTLMEWTSPYEF